MSSMLSHDISNVDLELIRYLAESAIVLAFNGQASLSRSNFKKSVNSSGNNTIGNSSNNTKPSSGSNGRSNNYNGSASNVASGSNNTKSASGTNNRFPKNKK
ncbi:hypothetical protein ACTFIZ_012364 [Dictyostelium cf. discoideum]